MVKHDVGRPPVMEGKRVIGIVSRTDTMRFFYDMMLE
jgi:CBS domain-containing protein